MSNTPYREAGEGVFTRACTDNTAGNGFEVKESSSARFWEDALSLQVKGKGDTSLVFSLDAVSEKSNEGLYWLFGLRGY